MKHMPFLILLLVSNLSIHSMEKPPQTILTALFKLRHESEWPYFEEFQQQLHANKETMIEAQFGPQIAHYCATNESNENVLLLNRWVELQTLDQVLKAENPERSLPNTLKESWYLEHGCKPFPYQGIVTKLCRSGLKADFDKLVDQARKNIAEKIIS